MAVLSDGTIKRYLNEGKLVITPEVKRINPASVDVTLGEEVKLVNRETHGDIDTRQPYPVGILEPRVISKAKGLLIHPGEHYLATTVERFEIPEDMAMYIIGKSTVGRLGLVPVTAGWTDPGFRGQITLEIYNVGNVGVRVYPGMFFAQAIFYHLDKPAEVPYYQRTTSLYAGQTGVTAPNTKNLYPVGHFDDIDSELVS
jgi:dCTP deaminase